MHIFFDPVNIKAHFGVAVGIESTFSNAITRDANDFPIVNCTATRITLEVKKEQYLKVFQIV